MSPKLKNELVEFHAFLVERLKNGGANLSPEDVLGEWRSIQPAPAELGESVAAVQRALEQAERGEGNSLEDFDRQFRQRHGFGKE
jgi:hypothetical protein